MKYFTHLHLHTSYSLNSGTIKIDNLINVAKKKNIYALAMTDYLNIFGAVKFYNSCIKARIKPIIGCEIPFVSQHNNRIITLFYYVKILMDTIILIKFYHLSINQDRLILELLLIIKKYNSDLLCLSGGRKGLCGINTLQAPIEVNEK